MRIVLIATCVLLGLGLAAPAEAANDMLGADSAGYAYTLDSSTGAGTQLGKIGFFGVNGMAVNSSGKVFAATDTGSLITIDPSTGFGSLVGTIPTPVRAMAFDPNDLLYLTFDYGTDDLLATVNVTTMAASKVGLIGFGNVEGLVFDGKTLYGWDRSDPLGVAKGQGLITIDTSTGVGTDVNPLIGSDYSTGDIRFLTINGGGTLYGGTNSLYTIDKASGKWALVGTGKYTDLRGCDFISTSPCPPSWQNYGAGTSGTLGVPTLTLDAQPIIGTQVNLQAGSSSSAAEISMLFVGFSQASIPGYWGGNLLLQPAVTVVLPLPAAGWVLPIPIPNDPKLCGFPAYFQILQTDPAPKMGAASSPGLEMSIGL